MSIPALLFEQCVKYITRHIGWVDTLQGVPDIIGERLWKGCVENDSFLHNDADTHRGLMLFVNAYGIEFMESFKCKDPYLLTEYCECLTVMCVTVTHLDISGCQLGNNNDFLRAIVNMKDLKVLNMSRNELSDGGFRLLLARHRMFQEGFQLLQYCDVSQNIFPGLIPYNISNAAVDQMTRCIALALWDVTCGDYKNKMKKMDAVMDIAD
ncbi:Leucine-rich repeat-containing protein 42 [Portunus trituberculatus]|uniref:Leucine-rich repeat-containing protein 42 n=1 Tax=Portunus trituberculatus TaxID=210409 RepID=A0A5B7EYG4_PORTR|nr:Leucine-rich repeat-containing protein 42 [Portunus trituberculatus]